ncbi:hypothetical protein E1171_00670 [Cytophagales bacterium RKSG123]|nr:hypothetical protein [Xanthovirga aplysinae]
MKNFDFKKRNLYSGPHLLGVLLIFAGLLALTGYYFLKNESSLERTLMVGLGAIIIGLVIVTSYTGTLIDFKGKRVKAYFSICRYKFGEWATLPTITTVKVIAHRYRSTNTPNGISPTLSGYVTVYRIFLYPKNYDKFLLSFEFSKKELALRKAEGIAQMLNANLIANLSN